MNLLIAILMVLIVWPAAGLFIYLAHKFGMMLSRDEELT